MLDYLRDSRLAYLFLVLSFFLTWAKVRSTGRPSVVVTYDDISYITSGANLLRTIESNGLLAFKEWLIDVPHSIWFDLISAFGLFISNYSQLGPYFINALFMTLLLFFCFSRFIYRKWHAALAASLFILSPFGFILFNEFRPDFTYILVLTFALFSIIRLPKLLGLESNKVKFEIRIILNCVIILTLIKPTWFSFTLIFLFFLLLDLFTMNLIRLCKKELFYFGIYLSFYFLFYGRHLKDYVFSWALNDRSQTLSLNGWQAISDSLYGAASYVGIQGLQILSLILFLLILLYIYFIRNFSLGFSLVDFKVFIFLVALLFPTFISRHPSPFQGFIIIFILLIYLSSRYGAKIMALAELNWINLGIYFFIGLMLVLIPVRGSSAPMESRKPINATERIANAIISDCLRRNLCSNFNPSDKIPNVYVTVITDVTPQGVEFYAIKNGVKLNVGYLDPLSDFDRLHTSRGYFISSKVDFFTNGIAGNSFQTKIISNYENLRFEELKLPKYLKYVVFSNFL